MGRHLVRAGFVVAALATIADADPPGATPTQPPLQAAPLRAPPPSSSPTLKAVDPSPNARTEALIGTGITAALVGGEIYSLVRMSEAQSNLDYVAATSTSHAKWVAAADTSERWHQTAYVFSGLLLVSVVVTGVLWTRTETTYRLAVTPQGAYVGYARAF